MDIYRIVFKSVTFVIGFVLQIRLFAFYKLNIFWCLLVGINLFEVTLDTFTSCYTKIYEYATHRCSQRCL